jgi:hypothetical protein
MTLVSHLTASHEDVTIDGFSDRPSSGNGLMLFRSQGDVRDAPQHVDVPWDSWSNPFKLVQIPKSEAASAPQSRIMFEDADGDGDLDAYVLRNDQNDADFDVRTFDFKNTASGKEANFSGGPVAVGTAPAFSTSIFGGSSTA